MDSRGATETLFSVSIRRPTDDVQPTVICQSRGPKLHRPERWRTDIRRRCGVYPPPAPKEWLLFIQKRVSDFVVICGSRFHNGQ